MGPDGTRPPRAHSSSPSPTSTSDTPKPDQLNISFLAGGAIAPSASQDPDASAVRESSRAYRSSK